MIRIALACMAMLLSAPEPAPETEYILRLEEFGSSYERLAPDQPLSDPRAEAVEQLLHQIEIKVVPERAFRVKIQQSPMTRELSGTVSQGDDGRFTLTVAYSTGTVIDGAGGIKRKDISSAKTRVSTEIGKRARLGGMKSHVTQMTPTGPVDFHRTLTFWVSLVKADRSQGS